MYSIPVFFHHAGGMINLCQIENIEFKNHGNGPVLIVHFSNHNEVIEEDGDRFALLNAMAFLTQTHPAYKDQDLVRLLDIDEEFR